MQHDMFNFFNHIPHESAKFIISYLKTSTIANYLTKIHSQIKTQVNNLNKKEKKQLMTW